MAKTAAQRKKEQRQREAEHLARVGAKSFAMVMYSGTRERLEKLKTDHGFEDDGEIVTLMIHNLSDCDMSRQTELLAVPQTNTRKITIC